MAKDQTSGGSTSSISMKHLRLGWLLLVVFTVAGLILEALHGFKVAWYLDVGNETRHTMLRLGHAHGTFLGLLNVAFAVTIHRAPLLSLPWSRASQLVSVSSVLLPSGFILGGLFPYDGDPGLGILLTPIGALCLIAGAIQTVKNLKGAED